MMKNNSLKVIGSVLGLGTFLMIAPSLVAAEESESTIPSININLLSQDNKHAGILDVKVSDLIIIDNIDVKIPNVEENAEELAHVSITNEEIGTIEANVLTKTETVASNEQAVVDIGIQDIPIVNKVDLEILKQVENTSTDSSSNESALVDVAIEDLIVTESVDVEVLKQVENTSTESTSSESALVDVAVEDLIVTENVDVEVLKTVENTSTNSFSNESTLVDVAIEDLIVTDRVEISVLDSENFMKDENKKETQKGVHLKLSNLPLLGTLHVGVLENQFVKKNQNQQKDSSLVTIGLGEESSLSNSLIDKVELNVLENSQISSKNLQAEKSAVVGLELNDTSLGDFSTYVLLSESTMDKGYRTNNSGLLEVNTDDLLLLEDIHLGVLDRHVDEGEEAFSSSEGLLQLDLIADLTDEISIDVLTNDEFTNNSGTYQNGKTISIGLKNDLVGEINVDILPTENSVAATPTNPIPPMEDVVEGVKDNEGEGGTSGEVITEEIPVVEDTPTVEDNPVAEIDLVTENNLVINKDENSADEQNAPNDEGIIVVEEEGSDSSANTLIPNPNLIADGDDEILTEEKTTEDDETSLGANFFNNDGNFFNGSSLPQTGGFFTGIMLLVIALSLLSGGWTIRKIA
ncbi:MAG: hypothetical protein WAM41_11065 [Psychrobacillus psychrotolerans]|uniref:hypothetical protein n=1 Tax=Psychrobacillus psychrotolerans TaxID=126156 RepID=UPI003BAF3340